MFSLFRELSEEGNVQAPSCVLCVMLSELPLVLGGEVQNFPAVAAHPIPRGGSMPFLAPLRLKGRTRTPSMRLNHNGLCLCPPLRLRGRTRMFRRREGLLLATVSGYPLQLRLDVLWFLRV